MQPDGNRHGLHCAPGFCGRRDRTRPGYSYAARNHMRVNQLVNDFDGGYGQ